MSGDATSYAPGWRVSTDARGRQWVGHGGSSVGGSTQFYIMPASELVIAMISNLSGFDFGDVLIHLAEIFLQGAQQRAREWGLERRYAALRLALMMCLAHYLPFA